MRYVYYNRIINHYDTSISRFVLKEYVCFSEPSPSLVECSRGFAAQKIHSILWKMREAHFPQNRMNQASAAGASKRS